MLDQVAAAYCGGEFGVDRSRLEVAELLLRFADVWRFCYMEFGAGEVDVGIRSACGWREPLRR